MNTVSMLAGFRKAFPYVSFGLFVTAIGLWVFSARGVLAPRPVSAAAKSQGINWQDITPTCEGVLCELGKAHAGIRDDLVRCNGGGLSLANFDEQLVLAKRRLRKLNVGGLEDPDLKADALLLRQSQIAFYTSMRQAAAQVLESSPADAGPAGKSELPDNLLDQWRGGCNSLTVKLAAFALKASVLPDELPDKRAATAIFVELEDLSGRVNEP